MINIKLYGTPTSTYEYIKSVLFYKMHELGIEMNFTEIQSWEDYLKNNIQSIPSVEINEKIIFNIPNNNVNNSINNIITYIKNETMKTSQKKILVPMDFDEASINALQYTLHRFPDSSVTVMHVFSGLVDLNDPVSLVPATPREEALEKLLKDRIQEAMGEWPEQIDSVEIISGTPSKSILKFAENHLYHFIALGAREKYDLIDKWFGSTSTNVLKKASIPVLVIPKDARYVRQSSREVIIALEEVEINPRLIEALTLTIDPQSNCHILHISKDPENSQTEEQEIIKNMEQSQFPFSYAVSVQQSNHITKTILNEVEEKDGNEIVVFPENTSIFQYFVNHSISKELIHKTAKIPVWSFQKVPANN